MRTIHLASKQLTNYPADTDAHTTSVISGSGRRARAVGLRRSVRKCRTSGRRLDRTARSRARRHALTERGTRDPCILRQNGLAFRATCSQSLLYRRWGRRELQLRLRLGFRRRSRRRLGWGVNRGTTLVIARRTLGRRRRMPRGDPCR